MSSISTFPGCAGNVPHCWQSLSLWRQTYPGVTLGMEWRVPHSWLTYQSLKLFDCWHSRFYRLWISRESRNLHVDPGNPFWISTTKDLPLSASPLSSLVKKLCVLWTYFGGLLGAWWTTFPWEGFYSCPRDKDLETGKGAEDRGTTWVKEIPSLTILLMPGRSKTQLGIYAIRVAWRRKERRELKRCHNRQVVMMLLSVQAEQCVMQ